MYISIVLLTSQFRGANSLSQVIMFARIADVWFESAKPLALN